MKTLDVRLTTGPGEGRLVGQLADHGGSLYFEYDPEFLKAPLWLSPFKLPPKSGLTEHQDRRFGPIFGLFDDSLPDGWGLLLMDRHFRQAGIEVASVSVLERLAYLGTRTMGALTYHPPSNQRETSRTIVDLESLSKAAHQVLRGTSEDILPELLRAGGSPGGARPKVLVGVRGSELLSGEDDLPPDFEHWLIKFNSKLDGADWGALEFAYGQMASAAGLSMPPTRLFESKNGSQHFGVKRFDREGKKRRHVHTFGNLIHANFRIPSVDYETLLKVVRILTRDHKAVLQMLRQMVFNIATHNRDDHVKNVAFLLQDNGEWILSPSYDLTFSEGPGGEHSMTVAGEGKEPGRRHVMTLAKGAGVSSQEAGSIIDEVLEATGKWSSYAGQQGLNSKSFKVVSDAITRGQERLSPRLF